MLAAANLFVAPSVGPELLRAADPPAAETATGNVDVEASRIYVRVGKRRLGHEHGVEGLVKSGTIHLDKREEAGELVFDMASLAADSDAARKYVGLESTVDDDEMQDVTATMQGKGVLNTAEYPTATFAIDSAALVVEKTEKGESQYQLDGELTLRDKTNPLKLVAAAVEEKDGKVRLQGEFRIKQTDYGIKPYSAAGGLVAVADELRIFGDIWVAKE
jgi:polyisoprenoid-binding protein YceI